MKAKSLPNQQNPISIVNHELKSQLFGIKAYVQLLQKRLEKLKDEKLLSYIKRIDTQVDTLTYSLTDFIDYVKISENALSLTPEFLDIQELMPYVLKTFHAIFPDAHTQIHGSLIRQVFADRNRIEKVLYSLLTNAAQYTNGPAEITITLSEKTKYIEITISDKGLGIESKDIKRIFEPFFSVPLENYKQRSGLGLFVAKKIIELHKGKLIVTSEPGKGSTFIIQLPL